INNLPLTILKNEDKNLIEFDVNYLSIDKNDTESEIAGLSIFSKKTGKLYFDGKNLLLSKRINSDSLKTIFIANIASSNDL
ncbi:MAG: hypothetical protein K6F69_05670, partial [Treponema sp.]|nr:hypothetical protein [Treponema sp.]